MSRNVASGIVIASLVSAYGPARVRCGCGADNTFGAPRLDRDHLGGRVQHHLRQSPLMVPT
jgi:hypothetical protein